MGFHKRIRIGLAVKLVVCLVATTAAFFTLFGYVNLHEQRSHSEELVVQSADRICNIIMRSTHYDMLHNDRGALYSVIREIGSEPGIQRIRIFNKEGYIRFSTDAHEVNTVVNKQAEACYGCHAQQEPLTKLSRPDRARIFTDAQGHRVLGVIRPIDNSPTCSNAACHAHRPGQRVLGVIDADLSLAGVDAQTAERQTHLVGFTVAAVLLLSVLSVVFIWTVVYRPVKELTDGTQRVAGGDLDYRLPVRSDDELGELAAAFNRMTADLSKARAEITGWTRTLEERVERKTLELERAHKSLLASEKMASIGKLAATVAHEVNNPLFGILTYTRLTLKELAQCEVPPGSKSEMLDQLRIVERESRRCGDIMRNLLTFARQAPNNRDSHQINTLVERAVVLIRHKLELQEIELIENLAPNLPPVYCDGGHIQQVILVLLVNATEAMSNGGMLEVSTIDDPITGVVRILVRDSGPGIPPDVMPQIFEPFFTTKEDQHRTGLGLAVAHSIVEQHGGDITVRSAFGEGTEFTVTLPANPTDPGSNSITSDVGRDTAPGDT